MGDFSKIVNEKQRFYGVEREAISEKYNFSSELYLYAKIRYDKIFTIIGGVCSKFIGKEDLFFSRRNAS